MQLLSKDVSHLGQRIITNSVWPRLHLKLEQLKNKRKPHQRRKLNLWINSRAHTLPRCSLWQRNLTVSEWLQPLTTCVEKTARVGLKVLCSLEGTCLARCHPLWKTYTCLQPQWYQSIVSPSAEVVAAIPRLVTSKFRSSKEWRQRWHQTQVLSSTQSNRQAQRTKSQLWITK